jgi:hypothetical protein
MKAGRVFAQDGLRRGIEARNAMYRSEKPPEVRK